MGDLNLFDFLCFMFWLVFGNRFVCKFFLLFFFVLVCFFLFIFDIKFCIMVVFLVKWVLFCFVLVSFFFFLGEELFLEIVMNVEEFVFEVFCLVCYCLCLLKFDGLLNFFGYFLYLNGWFLVWMCICIFKLLELKKVLW